MHVLEKKHIFNIVFVIYNVHFNTIMNFIEKLVINIQLFILKNYMALKPVDINVVWVWDPWDGIDINWWCSEEKQIEVVWERSERGLGVYGGGVCRPKKTWLEVVKNDMMELGLSSADDLNCHAWRKNNVRDMCWTRSAWNSPRILTRMKLYKMVCMC